MATKNIWMCLILGAALASVCAAHAYFTVVPDGPFYAPVAREVPALAMPGGVNEPAEPGGCGTGGPSAYELATGLPGFGIYLGEELIISDKDIESYNWTSHEIRLTPGGVVKIKSHVACDHVSYEDGCWPGSGLYEERFVAKYYDTELYEGVFSSFISSQFYQNEVVLTDVMMVSDDWPVMWLDYAPVDPRDNAIISETFCEEGKLVI